MLRHVVVWSMKPDAEAGLDSLFSELRALPHAIAEIRALSCGQLVNEAPYDAVLCVDVDDEEALERYREHPAHQPALQSLGAVAAELVVADYAFEA